MYDKIKMGAIAFNCTKWYKLSLLNFRNTHQIEHIEIVQLKYLGTEKVAELLIKNGATVDIRDEQGTSPLIVAAYWGNDKIKWIN